MDVQVKTYGGTSLVPVDTLLMTDRRIFIEGEINSRLACEFTKKVMLLNKDDSTAYIDVLINSVGGEMNSGMLMYDVIQASKAPIRTFCVGRAFSMGTVLFACGRHGRYMLPHSELMLHEPLIQNEITGNGTSLRSISDSLLEAKRRMSELIEKHTGKSSEEVDKAISYDHFFSPEESVEFGLCDEIVGFDRLL